MEMTMKEVLKVSNLTKKYDGFTLDRVSFSLPSGCIMGLVGENGAGKSTIIKLIMRVIKGDDGKVSIFGKEGREDFERIKEEIGIVMEEAEFPPSITVKEMNRVMRGIYRCWEEETYFSYIRQFSLPENKEYKELSRGMKMLFAIAVALSHQAKLLILDEATSGLDPLVRDRILDVLLEFTRDEEHSVLLSSHIVSDLEKVCDYIAFIHKGKMVLCEEKDRLLETYGILHCAKEELAKLGGEAVRGKRENPYGVDALVDKTKLPAGVETEKAALENIILYMMKGME